MYFPYIPSAPKQALEQGRDFGKFPEIPVNAYQLDEAKFVTSKINHKFSYEQNF